jgi:hypothetical protein
MVGAEGFEPPALCSQSRCATRLRYAPMSSLYRSVGALSRTLRAAWIDLQMMKKPIHHPGEHQQGHNKYRRQHHDEDRQKKPIFPCVPVGLFDVADK